MFVRLVLGTSKKIIGCSVGSMGPGTSKIKAFSLTPESFLATNHRRENAAFQAFNYQITGSLKIAVGSDHSGSEVLQEKIVPFLSRLCSTGIEINNFGVSHPPPATGVDFPDYAARVAESVAGLDSHFGLLVCGTGVGISLAANKYPGIVAANCWTPQMAEWVRQHNAANILVLGARTDLSFGIMQTMIATFLRTRFNEQEPKYLRRMFKVFSNCGF